MVLKVEAPGGGSGALVATDADSGTGGNLLAGDWCTGFNPEPSVMAQVGAVEGPVNRQGLAELAGPAHQIVIRMAGTVTTHGLHALQGLQRSDEHSGRGALWFSDSVEAVVHAVDKVDVSMTRRAVHGRVPAGGSGPGVAGLICLIEVGFDFHDAACQPLAIQYAHYSLAQEFLCHSQCWAGVEFAWQSCHPSTSHGG